jgi:hypothetical protein
VLALLRIHPFQGAQSPFPVPAGRAILARPATGRVIRRYEHQNPVGLVRMDIKKQGRIPDTYTL